MQYAVTLTLTLDTSGAPARGQYAEHTLRQASASALNKALAVANENMPAGLTLSNASAIAVSPIMPEESRR